jgi:signal transduction histidine kinase
MFRRARIRLTALYIGLFSVVLIAFSVVFYLGLATVLAPTFDLAPELTNQQVAEAAYQAALEQIGLALLAADVFVVGLVAIAAWILADRTLRPIREAHSRQRRFVADASHEMRSPLAAIRSSAEAALTTAASTDDLNQALVTAAHAAERLTRITNDLLLLARSDEMPAHPHDPVDLSVVVAETVELFAQANPRTPPCRMSLATDLRVAGDPAEISRIVGNLLDNAVRHGGGEGGEAVSIATMADDRDAVVEVTDDGPGIAAADLERIFEPFHRVHADAGGPDGSGLGLAIARSLARRNDGRLTVTSRPGYGSTFRLSLVRLT